MRATADDRILSVEEWGEISRRIAASTCSDPGSGEPACRWGRRTARGRPHNRP
ncbi:hypothetical protein J7F03_29070 [Streptomyces sp. ISL-43]|uniref:hypothetical protein n=1 Tax=Streptomyces sp. ISL-43 TaxID=2819183 RepID=UPI001BEC2D64|nr:hypothetical protein [Streptomyces sp. ISL-43]MBT2451056.1 hypothetical protein [Streptomyces sp. ISL-43]